MKKIKIIMAAMLLMLTFNSCDNDDDEMWFSQDMIEGDINTGRQRSLTGSSIVIDGIGCVNVNSADGDITATPLDKDIVKVMVDNRPDAKGRRDISIYGLKVGKTSVVVKDANNRTATLFVEVSGSYKPFKTDEEGMAYSDTHFYLNMETFHEEDAMALLVNKGWKITESYIIDESAGWLDINVNRSRLDYYGVSVEDYFFSSDTMTSFFLRDADGKYHQKSMPYSFDTQTGNIMCSGKRVMQVIFLDGTHMAAIGEFGTDSNGKKVYCYNSYELMTKDELVERQKWGN